MSGKKSTCKQMQAYVLDKHGLKVSALYIANLKDEFGQQKPCAYEEAKTAAKKRAAIIDAFIDFDMLDQDARAAE